MTAAIIDGTCASPGNVAVELRSLKIAEGGAYTSFTTIDLAVDDLTSGNHAIVAGAPDAPVACGEISGEGDNIYVAVPAQGDSTLGGVAWLHARDDRTQVSLFLGENLGQPATPSDDAPPSPPDSFSNETATYTSPNYGYTITYDTDQWQPIEDVTDSTQYGPEDNFTLKVIPGDDARATFSGGYLSAKVPATTFIERYLEQARKHPDMKNVAVRIDAEGNPIQGGDATHAWVSIDVTFSDRLGAVQENNLYIECWAMPEREAKLILTYFSEQNTYDVWAEAREDLVKGVNFPS